MKACWACGKELPKESLYYDYENEKGEMEHIFLCDDCLEKNNKVVECMSGCFTFVPLRQNCILEINLSANFAQNN